MWLAVIGLALVVSFVETAEGQGLAASTPDRVVLRSEGNELTASRTAAVSFRTLEALSAALDRPLPARSRVVRLTRAMPPEVVEYALCVTREGTLVFGEQLFETDEPRRGPVFVRGGLGRGYQPLRHDGPWAWLVPLQLSREAQVTLYVRATTGWPVRDVVIDVLRVP